MTQESDINYSAFQQLITRCQEAQIDCKEKYIDTVIFSISFNSDSRSEEPEKVEKRKYIIIKLKSGEKNRILSIYSNLQAKILLSIPFETIGKIAGYYALYSPQNNFIEAILDSERKDVASNLVYQRLQIMLRKKTLEEAAILDHYFSLDDMLNHELDNQLDDSRIEFEINSEDIYIRNIRVSIGLSTRIFSILYELLSNSSPTPKAILTGDTPNNDTELLKTMTPKLFRPITIRIENVHISSYEKSLEILENISNSLLFQLYNIAGLPMCLAPEIYNQKFTPFIRKTPADINIVLPNYQYDKEPMSLYWYASTAQKMPILQYLAYYQVIEFYFPRFKKEEAVNIITEALENPLFNSDTYTQMQNLINKINPLMNSGKEKDVLKAVIKNCVDPLSIQYFIEEKEDRKKFFQTYEKWKDITSFPIIRENGNIINDITLRIYDIRCKVVHTKNLDSSDDDESKFILPFSPQSQKLEYDIELVQFIARKVLEHCSKPLEF